MHNGILYSIAVWLRELMLPVIGNDQRDVAGATLVYRVGGFVVYEIAAEATPPAGSQAPARARP